MSKRVVKKKKAISKKRNLSSPIVIRTFTHPKIKAEMKKIADAFKELILLNS